MKQIKGNFWEHAPRFDAILVTTNGVVKSGGNLVMGAGIAKQFAERYPTCPESFGSHVSRRGNTPRLILQISGPHIISNPTKHHWKDSSPLDLIYSSACLVKRIVDEQDYSSVLSTPPGCGLGGLSWEEVEPVLQRAGWNSSFTIITFK